MHATSNRGYAGSSPAGGNVIWSSPCVGLSLSPRCLPVCQLALGVGKQLSPYAARFFWATLPTATQSRRRQGWRSLSRVGLAWQHSSLGDVAAFPRCSPTANPQSTQGQFQYCNPLTRKELRLLESKHSVNQSWMPT